MSLENIRRALERHAPSIEFVSYSGPSDPDHELRGPTVDDEYVVISELVGVGRHLTYRIAELYSGTFLVIGQSLEHEEPPQVILQSEPSWKTCAWFIHLMELNRIKVAWRGNSVIHLKDKTGKTALSIADTIPAFVRPV